MPDSKRTKLLILSQGPVPTPEHHKVEGGGLRCWGLAKGIHTNNKDTEVTVAYHDSYVQGKFTDNFEGIKVATWNFDNLAELIGKYSSVLVSYSMGELAVKVVDFIEPEQQLILDCYVPIYVEVSARESDDLAHEYHVFNGDVGRWAHILRRGDVFLCASEAQKNYYKGVLSAVGRINPATYSDELILIAPYGIYREEPKSSVHPITKLLKDKKSKKILWFGGIYPWFDLRNLVDAVKILNQQLPAELIIVGAKNPFNSHPDFVDKYDQLIEHVSKSDVEDIVVFEDWVKFEQRADWYMDSDIVVLINKIGEENKLAWRTRLVDFMWANLPVITNGGDPLGEELIGAQAAIRLTSLDAQGIADDLQKALIDTDNLLSLKHNLAKLKKNYYWDVVTKQLSAYIAEQKKAADRIQFGDYKVHADSGGGRTSKVKRAYSKARMLPAYRRKYGYRNTYHVLRTTAKNQFKKVGVGVPTQPRAVFVSHQLDISGAPYVFMEVVKQYVEQYGRKNIAFHTFNPTLAASLAYLNKLGVAPEVHLSREIGLQFIQGDVVVLNTVGHTMIVKNSIFSALESGVVKHLVWYIHEDQPGLLFNPDETSRIKKLLSSKKITMYMAGQQTRDAYRKHFDNESQIKTQLYKVTVPKKHHMVRAPKDFNGLNFILSGTVGDGRKGQLPILYAFMDFKQRYYDKNPLDYRDFNLEFVGVGDDFLSMQILKHAPKGLGKHFKHYGKIEHERYMEIVDRCNVTVCYSLREALPLFVFEGMYSGHVLLRNDSSGMAEQLEQGKNGYYLDSHDYGQVVEVIEAIANKKKTSNEQLAAMSNRSYAIAAKQADNDYSGICKTIHKNLGQ